MSYLLRLGCKVALLAGFAGLAQGQGLPKLEKDLTSLLIQSVAKKRLVGISVLVVEKGKGRYTKHLGYRDAAKKLAPNDDTIYEIGSLSKVFTRLAVASQDAIHPDDPISQHLPNDIRVPMPHEQEYSVMDLMTHTGFIVEHPCIIRAANPKKPVCHGIDPKVGFKNPYGIGTRAKTYDFVIEYSHAVDDFPWSFPKPGVFRRYSNVGIGLVGELLAETYNVSYEHFIATKLLKPLGMTRTAITLPCEQTKSCTNVAVPHLLDPSSKTWQPWPRFTMPGMPGAGAMLSSLKDLGKFLQANLAPETSSIQALIEQGQSRLPDVTVLHNSNICKPGESPENNFCNAQKLVYNYAWQPQNLADNYLYHEGRTTGSEAFIMFTADRSAGVVVLKNGSQIAVADDQRYHLPELVGKCALQMLGKIAKKPDACIALKLK